MNTTINELDQQWWDTHQALSDLQDTIRERKRAHEAKLTFWTNLCRPKRHYQHVMACFRYENMLKAYPFTPSGSDFARYYTLYRNRYRDVKAMSPLV